MVFGRGKSRSLLWVDCTAGCRIGWTDPLPLWTIVAIVKEAGDPIDGSSLLLEVAWKAAK
jgi:hypothetical protein